MNVSNSNIVNIKYSNPWIMYVVKAFIKYSKVSGKAVSNVRTCCGDKLFAIVCESCWLCADSGYGIVDLCVNYHVNIRADSGYGIVVFECLWVIVVCRVVYRVLKSGFVIKELFCLWLDTLIELQLWNENVC